MSQSQSSARNLPGHTLLTQARSQNPGEDEARRDPDVPAPEPEHDASDLLLGLLEERRVPSVRGVVEPLGAERVGVFEAFWVVRHAPVDMRNGAD